MRGSPTNDVVVLVQGGSEHGVEEDGPDAVVGFLQTDVVINLVMGAAGELGIIPQSTGCAVE